MSTATTTTAAAGDKPVRKFPTPCWTQDEALALIQAYRNRWYALRRGCLRTADWDAVAEDVGRLYPGAVPPKTSAQCRHKIEKLRQRYRAEKQRALSFSGGRFLSTWFFFDAMSSLEANGIGCNRDEETQSGGVEVVDLNTSHQSNTRIRLKAVAGSRSTARVRANIFGGLDSHDAEEEDEDVYGVESLIGTKLGKMSNVTSFRSDRGYQNLVHSGFRPRKCSKTGRNSMRRGNDSMGEIVSSIRGLADGFVKMEKMKMDMVHEIEKMRVEAEMRRQELLLESQIQMVQAFIKGLSEN